MAVVLLPFIDESMLQWACKYAHASQLLRVLFHIFGFSPANDLATLRGPLKCLNDEEKDRNQRKMELIFCHGSYPLATTIHDMGYKNAKASPEKKLKTKEQIDPYNTDVCSTVVCSTVVFLVEGHS